jgi:hypothetical protein
MQLHDYMHPSAIQLSKQLQTATGQPHMTS